MKGMQPVCFNLMRRIVKNFKLKTQVCSCYWRLDQSSVSYVRCLIRRYHQNGPWQLPNESKTPQERKTNHVVCQRLCVNKIEPSRRQRYKKGSMYTGTHCVLQSWSIVSKCPLSCIRNLLENGDASNDQSHMKKNNRRLPRKNDVFGLVINCQQTSQFNRVVVSSRKLVNALLTW